MPGVVVARQSEFISCGLRSLRPVDSLDLIFFRKLRQDRERMATTRGQTFVTYQLAYGKDYGSRSASAFTWQRSRSQLKSLHVRIVCADDEPQTDTAQKNSAATTFPPSSKSNQTCPFLHLDTLLVLRQTRP